MATLLLFGPARSAAGTSRVVVDASSVAELLELARGRFGPELGSVLAVSALWVNGEPAGTETPLEASDEVAVVPPVSGGA